VSTSQQEPFEEEHLLTPEEVAGIEARKQAAIRAAQETPGTCTKHLRLSIDFHITIAGTPPDDDGLSEPDPVYHARQARLLAAVKSNPAVLKQWMDDLIVSQMQQKGWSYWEMLTGGEIAFKDLLAPAIATLSEDDQAFFAEYDQAGYFEDGINLFQASFTIEEEPAVVVDMDADDEEEMEQPMKKYTITVQQSGDQFEATVLEIGVTVTGPTFDIAMMEAQRAIVVGMIAEEQAKRKREGDD